MADEFARLGLAIDSAPAAKASQELDKFANSSKRAEAANDDLAVAAEAAGRGIERMTRETRDARAALEQATTAARSVEAAAVALGRNAIAPTMAYVRAIEQVNTALRVQQQINRSVGVRSAGDAAARAADVAAYGEALDELRAKFNPLFAAERQHRQTIEEIAEAARVGAISEKERADAITRTTRVYEAQVAHIRRLEGALASQAAAAKAAAQTAVSRQTITPDRGADIAAYGAELDRLRAKYNPLYAAGQQYRQTLQEINEAAKIGAISERERAVAVDRTKTAFAKQAVELNQVAKASGLAGYQMMNLSRQMNDVATMALMGATPFQILTSQAGQVYQVLQEGQGGVTGSLKYLGERLAALATPARIAGASLAAVGITAVAAYASWMNGQAEVERSLLGIGRASGVTAAQINDLAAAYAGLGRVSTVTARQIASSMAATGQIAPDLFGDAIANAKGLATVLGVDVPEAAGVMAQALTNPARAVGQLNDRLGAFDAATLQRVQSLDAQNRLSEAQRIIIDRIRSATEGADKATTGWSRNLESISTMISDAWDDIGKWIDDKTSRGSLEVQLKQLEAQRDAQQKVLDQIRGSFVYSFRAPDAQAALDDLDEKIRAVRQELERGAAKAGELKQALASLRLMEAINITLPEINAQRVLDDRAAAMRALAGDPNAQRSQGITQEQATLAAERAAEAARSYLTTQQASTKQLELQNQAITARSPLERANLAYKQKMAELDGANTAPEEKKRLAQLAYNNALKEGNFALSEQERQRILAAQESIAQQQLETQLIGKTAEEQALLRANFASYWDLKREAAQNGLSDIDQAQYERLKKLNEEMARGVGLAARLKLQSDLLFERDQLGRTEGDQQIAASLRSAGMKVDLNSDIAASMRLNAELKDLKETANTALSGFASDLLHGASAAEALSNQLASIADKLLKMATDQLVSQAFGGLLGGTGGSAGLVSALPKLTGAGFTTGIYHVGGIVNDNAPSTRNVPALAFLGAPKFHTGGGFFGADERPAVLRVGEEVLTRDDPRHSLNLDRIRRPDVGRLDGLAGSATNMTFAPNYTIDARGSQMTEAQFKAIIEENNRALLRQVPGVVEKARSRMIASRRT